MCYAHLPDFRGRASATKPLLALQVKKPTREVGFLLGDSASLNLKRPTSFASTSHTQSADMAYVHF